MTPSVLVLEDTDTRVTWLRAVFPELDVVHVYNVVDFLKARRVPHAMIVLDHDLAGQLGDSPEAADIYDAGQAYDEYGLSGMDAVRACDSNTPVVVWSANPVWNIAMRNALQLRGVPVVQYPFHENQTMAHVIRDVYFNTTGVWLKVNWTALGV